MAAFQREVDHFHDGISDRRNIRILRDDGVKAFDYLGRKTCIRTGLIFSGTCFVCWLTGMREMIRTASECAGNND